jgi:hypothetical protein
MALCPSKHNFSSRHRANLKFDTKVEPSSTVRQLGELEAAGEGREWNGLRDYIQVSMTTSRKAHTRRQTGEPAPIA